VGSSGGGGYRVRTGDHFGGKWNLWGRLVGLSEFKNGKKEKLKN